MLSATKLISTTTTKKLEVEQFRFLKREQKELGVASFIETASYKVLY